MKITTDLGVINISNDVIGAISGYAASNCFGVKGMVQKGVTEGVIKLLKRDNMSRGVRLSSEKGALNIELHVAVEHGVNIAVISHCIMDEVRFVVEHYTGISVNKIDVCVDSIVVS